MTLEHPPATVPSLRPTREWGFLHWLGLFMGSYVVTLVVSAAVAGGSADGDTIPARAIVAGAAVLPACFMASTAWMLGRFSHRTPVEILHLDRPASDIAIGAGVGFALQALLVVALVLVDVEAEQQIGDDLQRIEGLQLGVLVVLVGVVAPLAEELFFRVLLFDALARRMPVAAAVAVQAAVFGLVHAGGVATVQDALVIVPALTLAGAVFGILFARGFSIWTCVAAHVAFNLLAVVQLLAA